MAEYAASVSCYHPFGGCKPPLEDPYLFENINVSQKKKKMCSGEVD